MSKFKTGDMVRILHTDYPETDLQVGEVREVFSTTEFDCYLIGKFNETGNTANLCFYDEELELIEPEQSTPEPNREIKVGDTVERVSGANTTTPIGFRGVVSEIMGDEYSPAELRFENGQWGYEREKRDSPVSNWKIIEPVNDSPVIYETVRKAKIVPGEYDGMVVGTETDSFDKVIKVYIDFYLNWYTKDQLAKIIGTLTTIHKAMEEGA